MISRFLFILSFAGILSQNINKIAILINFKINQEYIAENLCVNKDEPESCCEGKCQLEKELIKEEKKEKTPSAPNLKEKHEAFPCVLAVKKILFYNNKPSKHFTFYITNYSLAISNSIFHPPPIC
jgi:hypothetical protein